jgi:transcriptional regulator with XRE-family HTH domain
MSLKNHRFSGIVVRMSNIHNRLKEIRKYMKLSIREFSKEIYVSHSLYGQTEYGTREPNDRIIQLISSRFNISKDWILNGKGEMFSSPPPDIRLERILEIYNIVDETLKDCLLEQSKILLKIYRNKKEE